MRAGEGRRGERSASRQNDRPQRNQQPFTRWAWGSKVRRPYPKAHPSLATRGPNVGPHHTPCPPRERRSPVTTATCGRTDKGGAAGPGTAEAACTRVPPRQLAAPTVSQLDPPLFFPGPRSGRGQAAGSLFPQPESSGGGGGDDSSARPFSGPACAPRLRRRDRARGPGVGRRGPGRARAGSTASSLRGRQSAGTPQSCGQTWSDLAGDASHLSSPPLQRQSQPAGCSRVPRACTLPSCLRGGSHSWGDPADPCTHSAAASAAAAATADPRAPPAARAPPTSPDDGDAGSALGVALRGGGRPEQ